MYFILEKKKENLHPRAQGRLKFVCQKQIYNIFISAFIQPNKRGGKGNQAYICLIHRELKRMNKLKLVFSQMCPKPCNYCFIL